ncbi:WXG100 family type VII secretion target [Neobacillus sp. Marseille-QA0830]
MSPFINVNYTEFEKAATAVDSYVNKQKDKMNHANQVVAELGASWQGKDYQAFKASWNELDDAKSTAGNMKKAMEDYADTLRYVADQYKKAQKVAIDRANSL